MLLFCYQIWGSNALKLFLYSQEDLRLSVLKIHVVINSRVPEAQCSEKGKSPLNHLLLFCHVLLWHTSCGSAMCTTYCHCNCHWSLIHGCIFAQREHTDLITKSLKYYWFNLIINADIPFVIWKWSLALGIFTILLGICVYFLSAWLFLTFILYCSTYPS